MSLLNSTASRSGSAGIGSAATDGAKKVWDAVWLLGVPLLIAVAVDMRLGDSWGSIPAPWLDGGSPTPGIAALLALLAALTLCVVLNRLGADVLLGALPIAGVLVAHVGGQPGWMGAVVGLVIGLAVLFARRR